MFGALHLGLGLTPRIGSRGVRAYVALANLDSGFVFDPIDDFVLVRDAATPANNFTGSMAQAVDRGILVNASPPTKMLLNSSGILTSGSNLRCQYSAAGVPLGFLPELQRTNLLLNSAALATQSVTVSATAYTLSFEGTGTVTLSGVSSAGPLVGTGATDRVSLTFTPSAGTLTLTVSGTVAYANLEAGLFRTSPIVTAGSQVTRAADNLYVDLTKVPFGAEYTVIAHAQPSPESASAAHLLFGVGDNTINERHQIISGTPGTGNLGAVWRTGNVLQASLTSSAAALSAFKVATATAINDFEIVSNGASGGTDAAGDLPIGPTRLQIGAGYSNVGSWAAPIGFLALIPERLSQADMIARTS